MNIFRKLDTTFKCLQRIGSSKRVSIASVGMEFAFLAKRTPRKRSMGEDRERGATRQRYNMS